MSELSELYQELILDHNRRPRNFGALPDANRSAEGYNPLCGDRLKASASLMTDAVKGRTVGDAHALFDRVHTMLTLPLDRAVDESGIGKLAVLSGVREFPVRIKCASLAWHTLKAALAASPTVVKTE
jgi:nitrogen fixation NifU-like protein